MFVVGVTGGIGSGKSRVSDEFKRLGISIVDTDVIAREVVAIGSSGLTKIRNRFGKEILLPDGGLDRKKLREIIFSRPDEKKWLENLLHPRIRIQTREQLEQTKSPYAILVSPLLLESPDAGLCNKILVVDAPSELQIQRTVSRDAVSAEQVEKTINTQMPRQERLKRADDVIDNSGTWERTREQILSLHQKYLQCAKDISSSQEP